MSTRTERKFIRLSVEESETLESIIKNTGKSFTDLVIQKIIEADSDGQILDSINFESTQIKDKLDNYFSEFLSEYKKDMEDFGRAIAKNLYKKFFELKLDEAMKKNIYTFEKGDLIRTSKNHLLIVTSIDTENKSLKLTLAPIISNAQIQTTRLEDIADSIVNVYRQ
jgi:hypothetical protein